MYAELMRAAGVQIGFDERECAEEKFGGPVGAGGAAVAAAGGHAGSAAQVTGYGKFDAAGLFAHFAVQ